MPHISSPLKMLTTLQNPHFKFAISKTLRCFKARRGYTSQILPEIENVNETKTSKAPPVTSLFLQVLGNGSRGEPRSLYVNTCCGSFFFNCGEGTTRLALEHGIKLSTITDVFLTHNIWENVGGLFHVLHYFGQNNPPKVHGPKGLGTLLRHEVPMDEANVKVLEKCDVTVFENDALRIQCVPIVSDNPLRKEREYGLAYICKPPVKPAHVKVKECKRLQIPTQYYEDLEKGTDMILPDGKMVHSRDVTYPEIRGPTFAVVECQSVEYLDSLINNEAWNSHLQSESLVKEDRVRALIHFTPPEVMNDVEYRIWMSKFGKKTNHIVLNWESHRCSSTAIHSMQSKLNVLNSKIFPTFVQRPPKQSNPFEKSKKTSILDGKVMMKYILRPEIRLDWSESVSIQVCVERAKKSLKAIPRLLEDIEKLSDDKSSELHEGRDFPQIIFLGTQSATPGVFRNDSAILLQTSEFSSVLLDCGEGTAQQLIRFFGSNADAQLRKMKGIFVSHLHIDHFIGLIQVLKERSRAFSDKPLMLTPVSVIAPAPLREWLEKYNEGVEPILEHVKFIPSHRLVRNSISHESRQLHAALGITRIKTVNVEHRRFPFGCVIDGSDWKIVYSGDTMPCDRLVEAGKGCDVLIHEATLEHSHDAKEKMHSSIAEAVQVGKKMDAKFTLLTHFSSQYEKLPPLEVVMNEPNVGVAFDFMQVGLGDLQTLSLLTPAIKAMFPQTYRNMVKKSSTKLERRKKDVKQTDCETVGETSS